MIEDRKRAFDIISRAWAITRFDIEHHLSINDQSLNLHGENFFRDLFNSLYGMNFENTNFQTFNAPCIDLLDKSSKSAYQITTTRTKEKIDNTLAVLCSEKYKNYRIKIFYLLDKAKPNKNTVAELNRKYSVNIKEMLFDYSDIIQDIDNLEEQQLISLCEKFFVSIKEKYTDHIALDLVVKHLLKKSRKIKKNYDDTFGTLKVRKKLKVNKLNERISAKLIFGLDYRQLLEDLSGEENTISELRELVVDDFYKEVLIEILSAFKQFSPGSEQSVEDLHSLAIEYECDFNKIISKLYDRLLQEIEVEDFNTFNISWMIISYFFELCDVGVSLE